MAGRGQKEPQRRLAAIFTGDLDRRLPNQRIACAQGQRFEAGERQLVERRLLGGV